MGPKAQAKPIAEEGQTTTADEEAPATPTITLSPTATSEAGPSKPATNVAARTSSLVGRIKKAAFASMGREEITMGEAAQMQLEDDHNAEVLARSKIGTALLYVPILNPEWKDASVKNRTVDDAHVKKLKKSMSKRIKRTEPQSRFRVSVTLADWEKALQKTIEKYIEWNESTEYGLVSIPTRDELQQRVSDSYNKRGGKLMEFPLIVWDDAASQDPQLDAGQHRRIAFIELMAEVLQKSPGITPNNINETAWVCDIHDLAKCNSEYFTVARVNKEDAYKSQSAGDSYLTAWEAWTHLTAARRKEIGQNKTTVAAWLEGDLGLQTDSADRYNQLLKHDFWNALAKTWCDKRFGRDTFVISNFTDIMQHRIPSFWQHYFSSMSAQFSNIFGPSHVAEIKANELQTLSSLGIPSKNLEDLQVCFYPGIDDQSEQKNKRLTINPAWFEGAEYKDYRLTKPKRIGSMNYPIRRPGFLSHLNERQYDRVFKNLASQVEQVMSPSDFVSELKTVGGLLSVLCLTTIFMVDPAWKLPSGAEVKKLNDTDLVHVIAEKCLSLPEPQTFRNPHGASAEEMTAAAKQNNDKAIEFVMDVRDLISQTRTSWAKPESLKAELSGVVNKVMSVDNICHFVDRFAHQPWQAFFRLFMQYFGVNRLTGCMIHFKKKPSLIDEISNTIKPLDLMYKSAYRPVMKQRFEDMAVLLKSNLDEVVGRAADFATICTEYQQIEHFMRRYDEADRLLQENAEPDDIFDAGDGMAVGEYQACQARLNDLQKAFGSYGVNVDTSRRDQAALLPHLPVNNYLPSRSRGYDPSDYVAPPTATAVRTPSSTKRSRKEVEEEEEDDDDNDGDDGDASPLRKKSKGVKKAAGKAPKKARTRGGKK